MIPASFDYVRAGSFEEVFAALADPDAKVIAGGLSLLPMMKLRLARPAQLVDIAPLDLAGVTADGESTRVGALTAYADLLRTDNGDRALGAIAESAARVGDLQVRNSGTVGGGIAHADPASDAAAGVLAMQARLVLRSPGGTREVEAADFFVGPFTTVLEQQELLTALVVPALRPDEGSAYESFEDPASGYPLAGVAVRLRREGDRVAACSIGVTGVASHPFRARRLEELITDRGAVPAIDEARDAFAEVQPLSDLAADAEYRRHLAAVAASRAVARALARAAAPVADGGSR